MNVPILLVPILLYHHVNCVDTDPTLNVRPEIFEKQMAYLADNGYSTIFLDELFAHINNGFRLPKKTVAITFDDGYLDNLVYAYSILKKYNFKATIFVITRNVKEEAKLHRPIKSHFDTNFESINNERNGSNGFLTWEELREMEASGLIDVQSHSHNHGYYYVDEEIVDFNRGQYWWCGWPTDGDTRFGIPIYTRKPMLLARRYFDDTGLRQYLASYISRYKNENSFEDRKNIWISELREQAAEYISRNGSSGYYESRDEKANRIIKDLSTSRRLIEERLNKRCAFLSYPSGKYDSNLLKAAKRCGFKGAFTNRPALDRLGSDRLRVGRIIVKNDFESFVWKLMVYSNEFQFFKYGILSRLYGAKERLAACLTMAAGR